MDHFELEEQFEKLFSPVSTDDFWRAKELLTSAEIPYKITGELRPAYHYGGRYEIGSTSNIMVLKKDTASAILVCNELIEKAKELEKKWTTQESTLMERFMRFFRIF